MGNTQWIMGSDGALEAYDHPFNEVSQDDVEQAESAEKAIRHTKLQIEYSFLDLAAQLDAFDRDRHYLARGYETMFDWAKSPEIELSPRLVRDLLRIVREVIPVVEANFGDIPPVLCGDDVPPEEAGYAAARLALMQAGISKVRAALPLLRLPENAEEEFVEAVTAAPDIPYREFLEQVKAQQGKETPIDKRSPAVFKARAKRGDTYTFYTITCSDGVDVYTAGKLMVKHAHVPRWEQRFGDFLVIEDE